MKSYYFFRFTLKTVLFSVLILFLNTPLSAQNVYVQPIGNSFELAQKPKITFSSRNLIIETSTSHNVYPLSEIQNLSFGQQAGLDISVPYSEDKIRLYPNPVKDEFRLDIPVSTQSVRYRIYDIVGAMLQTGKINSSTTIHIGNYRPGFYIIRLDQNGQEIQSFKIVKQ